MFKTIVALATPPFKSALAIIRVSGNDSFDIVNKIFSKNILQIKERTSLVGNIISGDDVIDQVVIICYKNPHSFTGEDMVEIICHGSLLISNQIIELLIANGATYATNGEYSERAFLNGKIDLIQAEAINDVINSISDESKHISLMSLEGKTSKLIYPIKTRIADILSLIEVNIDYPEYEDIEVANKDLIIKSVDEIIASISTLLQKGEKALLVKEGVKVVIIGKPNVGKSSLLNALLGQDKAIVTDVAGTTRDIVEGDVNLGGLVLHLIDTAGIRETIDKIEAMGVNKSLSNIKDADLVLVVLDASRLLDQEDTSILEITKPYNPIIVYNKIDLVDVEEKRKDDVVFVSALNNDLSTLKDSIYKRFGIDQSTFKNPALANTRQLGLLNKMKLSLLKAKEDAQNDLPVDLISVSLMEAYHNVLEILGEEVSQDFTKEIFSRFCVGK